MAKLTKGPQSLTTTIGSELKQDPPPWNTIQPQAKEFVELAKSMSQHKPPRGSDESWQKLTADYANSAVELERAVTAKDKEAATKAHAALSGSCMACHREHRGMAPGGPGGFGSPGGFGPKGGPPGGFGPKGGPPGRPQPSK
jgi:hypothetical protein